MKIVSEGFVIYQIDKNVFQRGRLHDLSYEYKAKKLDEFGITIVVALAPIKIDPDLVRLDKLDFIEYIHRPIADGILYDSTRLMLLQLATDITKAINKWDSKVLVHCNAGRNRSGLLTALILRDLHYYSGAEALEIVRRERPNAIANEHYETFLKELS